MKRWGVVAIVLAAVVAVALGVWGVWLWLDDEESESPTESLIRLNGGVEAVFTSPDSLNDEQWNAAKAVLQKRLVLQDILNADLRVEEDRLIVRAPLAENQEIKFLQQDVIDAGRPGRVTFRMEDEVILESRDMVSAKVEYDERHNLYTVQVTLTEAGKDIIAKVTTEEYTKGGTMAVWLDDRMICNPVITAPITNGEVAFHTPSSGEARELASIVNSGPMPVVLKAESGEFLMPDMVADGD